MEFCTNSYVDVNHKISNDDEVFMAKTSLAIPDTGTAGEGTHNYAKIVSCREIPLNVPNPKVKNISGDGAALP